MDIKLPTGEISFEICLKGKMARTAFPKRSDRTSELLELIHSDVCGPMGVESYGKAKYFVEFIDEYARWCKHKHEVLEVTKEFITLATNQKQRSVRCFQSDNGT
ncbi:hypothetical protein Trydic_g20092 [Trypoxylus dichotomus]